MPKPNKQSAIPDNYPVCLHHDCPVASACLHQMAYATMLERDTYLRLINPTRCGNDASCTFYRDSKPVMYARGFAHFQKHMYPDQYRRFMAMCISHWSRNPYFERRRGDRLLPPAEQEFLLNALKEVGVTEDMAFGSYEEHINWCD